MTFKYIKALAGWVPDAMLVLGAGAISYGAWMIYPPAGFIVGGLLVTAAGYLLARGAK